MRKLWFPFVLGLLIAAGCTDGQPEDPDERPDIPLDVDRDPVSIELPVQMWVDAHANLARFDTRESVVYYLGKMKDAGFSEIYLDVKPAIGYAMYASDILPILTKWGDVTLTRDWDYLGVWIEEAEKQGMEVVACISTLGFGYSRYMEGLVYDDSRWDGKTQVKMNNNDPDDLLDIRDLADEGYAMLNPTIEEVRSFVVSIVEEIVAKYPKIKGICLDYYRWENADFGFSDATMSAFKQYSGLNVTDRNEILTSTGGIGPYYSRWIEFRSMAITSLISEIRAGIKAIDPDTELYLWASAHWISRYSVGQNFASKRYVPSGAVYTDTYSKTGFADLLDAFSLGAYADAVWKTEAPGSDWSIENFVTSYDRYIMGDCKVYGSIGTYAPYGKKFEAVSDAVYLCLKNTDGLMVFEISHVINNNQWDAIRDGIKRAEEETGR